MKRDCKKRVFKNRKHARSPDLRRNQKMLALVSAASSSWAAVAARPALHMAPRALTVRMQFASSIPQNLPDHLQDMAEEVKTNSLRDRFRSTRNAAPGPGAAARAAAVARSAPSRNSAAATDVQ